MKNKFSFFHYLFLLSTKGVLLLAIRKGGEALHHIVSHTQTTKTFSFLVFHPPTALVSKEALLCECSFLSKS